MAIHSTSLLNPPQLLPMADGIEFYVTESESVSYPTPDDKPQHFRACTVLVSFAKSDADRTAFRPLLHALAFGQTSSAVCDGAEWLQKLPKRLLERLKSIGHDMVVAAIYAGSGGDSDAETVQAAVDSLQQCFGARLTARLVVADTSSHRLSRVTGVSGFVVGANGTNAETARSVFLCLAMFMAPKTQNGIDLADLHPALGTADSNTVLAYALWLRDGDGCLLFASAADAQAVSCTAHVVAVPLFDGSWRRGELRRFCQAVREQAVESATKIYFAADGAIASGIFSSQVGMVPIMYASPSTILQG